MGLNQLLLVALLLGAGSPQIFWAESPQVFWPELQPLDQPGVIQPVQMIPVQLTQTGSAAQASAGLQSVPTALASLNAQSDVAQGPSKPLNWRFPSMPVVLRPAPVQFDSPPPVSTQNVAAVCTEKIIHVEVSKDLFGTGRVIDVAALSLGGCPAVAEDPSLQILIFQSDLQGCGSNLIVTADELVYIFTLIYSSSQAGSPIIRTLADVGTTVSIECHYPRFHNVSSNPLVPFWIPHASVHVAEEQLVFSLRLMMDDWVSERASNQYQLGDIINLEASVVQFNHVPLRVYVDSCVATSVPDMNAVPRYFFIGNHGCFVDGKLTGSNSHFMPQTVGSALGFQLEAFLFQQANTSTLFFACLLKATAAQFAPTVEDKACSFYGNGWIAAYGDNGVCSCCDGTCLARKRRDLPHPGLHVERTVRLGPIVIKN